MAATAFESDQLFHQWVGSNPHGFVINVRRRLSPDYVVLHRSTCPTVSSRTYAPGALTERSYRKIAATSQDQLLDWIKTHMPAAPGFSKRCTRCCP